MQNLDYLLRTRKPCCVEGNVCAPAPLAVRGDSESRYSSTASVSSAQSAWKPFPTQPVNRHHSMSSIQVPGREYGHQFMTPSNSASCKSSTSPSYTTRPAPHQQLVPESIQRNLSPVSSNSRSSAHMYDYSGQLSLSHTSSFEHDAHADAHHIEVPEPMNNVNSCLYAADIITSMAGGDSLAVRTDLGCGSGADCRVSTQLVFEVMDRYTGTAAL